MKRYIKICGITTPDALDTCVSHGAHFIGFVFHQASPRNIDIQQASLLASRLPASVRSVAVIVDPEDDFLDALTTQYRPNFIQLHGNESPTYIQYLRSKYGIPIIKALRIASTDDLKPAKDFANIAEMLLLDAKVSDPNIMGGSGHTFDWSFLKGFTPALPWFLSGGLNQDNIADAIRQTNAQYLDISSGVESSKGVKDNTKITTLLERINSLG